MFKAARILWHSGDEIRDLMVRFYTERKELPSAADGNWHIIPDTALRTLEKQALAESGRPDANQ
jgi:hypothetical protein